ncbi:Heparinase II/III-like protein [Paenibacillus sp. 1_12]|uniref:heparinase II/III domain-containing protein n=1 Tax=Paenibacillus sp. 1_12 TaxID=1566278 RepID=UPI0008F2149F|nr:heparinase II/III family protein [Paenibacillus sp. 1_12]SFL73095.1 Heparinase II/III-like protein [Paenibacillus sp. 1_12]
MKLTDYITLSDINRCMLGEEMAGRLFPSFEDRQAWEQIPQQLRNEWISEAELYLNYEWPSLRASAFMAYFEEGSRKPYDSVDNERRAALCTLLIAECLEAKGRFLRQIVDVIWLICEQTTWCAPAHHYLSLNPMQLLSDTKEPLFDLTAGETASLLAWTSHLLHNQLDQITTLIRERIRVEIERRILTPYMERNDFWWMGFGEREVNNWNPWCNANMLTVVLLQEMASEKKLAIIDKILRSLDRYLEVQFEDGGCDEGSSYWARAAGMLLVNLELIYRSSEGALQVYDQPLIRKLGQFVYKMYIDDHYFVNFADGSAIASQDYSMIHLYGLRIQDEQLQALGQKGVDSYRVSGRSKKGISFFQEMISLLSYADIQKELALPRPLIKDTWLPDLQVMAARQYDSSSQGLYVAAKGGHNDESHNHNDIGHYVIYWNGKPFLIDIGVETYTYKTFSPERYEIWTMQSGYHSVPVINGFEQKEGRPFRARNVVYKQSETSVRFELDLAGAYPAHAGVSSWNRSLVMERGDAHAAEIRLREQCQLTEPSEQIVLHMMTCHRPELSGKGVISLRDAQGDGLLVSFEDEQWQAEFEHIHVVDTNLQQVWGNSLYRIKFTIRQQVVQGDWSFRITADEV